MSQWYSCFLIHHFKFITILSTVHRIYNHMITYMAVQHTFISIYESAPIRNLTLFSIVAVDNHQLAQII